ncbi:hypothetical protein M427DRAFT_52859 [Gonapodya prolifera JEL478]|uniref:Histone deacetylase complex subunit SAP30 Sin3 binding domain-containing protein n=1 Tax=Gonapodya prolifera (strain JEL478) TaxID=1344416 RepID=A0A139ARQ4_GONPJ|nr:hypothetical protein M427DRAFT_52859 [Gonapodya prolifera JEL478]|eukprot:KXS19420.1 hypothetical protein M427DRAFT_52859 [Gonapodya prolifera JEL478]
MPPAQKTRTEYYDMPKVDFTLLPDSSLRRYRRAHALTVPPDAPREDLAREAARHFANQTVDEKDAIVHFVYSVRNKDRVLKLPPTISLDPEDPPAPNGTSSGAGAGGAGAGAGTAPGTE